MQVALEQTAAQKQEKRVACTMLCRKLGVIPLRMMNENDDDDDEDNIPSQNWHRTVGMTVISLYHSAYSPNTVVNNSFFITFLIKQGKRLEIYDFVMHRVRFYWIIKRKPKIHVLILGGGSCDF